MLTPLTVDIAALTAWRRALHRRPERSGDEAETAKTVVAALAATSPDQLITSLGGHGVAAVYNGASAGPTVLFRAELDALPITELTDIAHRSEIPGTAHLCGHDGHMAILLALAQELARQRSARGRVVVLFQPAEETGAGARAVVGDVQFAALQPDFAFALHNMPGLPFGQVALKPGPAACASRGLRISLAGKTAHASMPETGASPVPAMARLMSELPKLGVGGPVVPGFRLVTVTHAHIGEPAFGIAPSDAELWVTLRTLQDADMAALHEAAVSAAEREAAADGLLLTLSDHDSFDACDNHPEAVQVIATVLAGQGIPVSPLGLPMRASEDFGVFGSVSKSALFLLGAGETHPALHNPDYDFPDGLITPGAAIFAGILRQLLG